MSNQHPYFSNTFQLDKPSYRVLLFQIKVSLSLRGSGPTKKKSYNITTKLWASMDLADHGEDKCSENECTI